MATPGMGAAGLPPAPLPEPPHLQTNSCALAHVLQRPDAHRIHGTATCTTNHCPGSQRERCATASPVPVTADDIRSSLVWLGVPKIRSVNWDATQRTATLEGSLSTRDRNNVAQRYAITIRARRAVEDRYWAGRLEGGRPLVIDS